MDSCKESREEDLFEGGATQLASTAAPTYDRRTANPMTESADMQRLKAQLVELEGLSSYYGQEDRAQLLRERKQIEKRIRELRRLERLRRDPMFVEIGRGAAPPPADRPEPPAPIPGVRNFTRRSQSDKKKRNAPVKKGKAKAAVEDEDLWDTEIIPEKQPRRKKRPQLSEEDQALEAAGLLTSAELEDKPKKKRRTKAEKADDDKKEKNETLFDRMRKDPKWGLIPRR